MPALKPPIGDASPNSGLCSSISPLPPWTAFPALLAVTRFLMRSQHPLVVEFEPRPEWPPSVVPPEVHVVDLVVAAAELHPVGRI
jgi:hypothetical protein